MLYGREPIGDEEAGFATYPILTDLLDVFDRVSVVDIVVFGLC